MGNVVNKPNKRFELKKNDFKSLIKITYLPENEIKEIYEKFKEINPTGLLNKWEFIELYTRLRPEGHRKLENISQFVFHAFDKDKNGFISFDEFIIGFGLTTRGDLRQKLEYAFDVHDIDGNGVLDKNEITTIIDAMITLFGSDLNENDSIILADQCMLALDGRNENKITKEKFITVLMENYGLRSLLSPFS